MAGDMFDGLDQDGARAAISDRFKGLHADVSEGKRTLSEVQRMAEKAGADLTAMDRTLAELKAQATVANASARRDGPEGELRQFVNREGDGPTVRLFGGNAKFAGQDVGRVDGLLTTQKTYSDWHQKAKDIYEGAVIAAAACRRPHEPLGSAATLRKYAPKALAALGHHLSIGPGQLSGASEQVARIFTDASGSGGEFIPDITLPELDKALALSDFGLVGDLIASRPMSGKNLKKPFLSTNPRPYLYGSATVEDPSKFTSSTPPSGENSIDAKGFAVRVVMDRDAIDDSIVDSVAEMREIIVRGHMLGREEALFHGDTAGTHMDTGIGAWNVDSLWDAGAAFGGSSDIRRAWLGLRARAEDIGATAKLDMATFSYANALALAQKLAGPKGLGALGSDLVLAVGYDVYLGKVLGLEQVATADKYGANASVLGAFPARLGPWSIATTPMLPSEFNASGIYDGATTTKGVVVGFLRNRYAWYNRQNARVELDTDITSGVANLVATQRLALHSADAATVANVVVGYNI